MESLKSIYHNMSDMSKMLIKILLGILAGLLIIFILVLAIRIVKGGKSDFSTVEKSMQKAAIKYYEKYSDELPDEFSEVSISSDTLVEKGYLKSLTETLEDYSCSGSVTVINNDENYAYLPTLDCGDDYKTKILLDSILENNEIVDNGDGLYLDVNNDYVFRGEFVNNYLILGGKNYRILRVKEDGSIRLLLADTIKKYKSTVWDDRYNIEKEDDSGINDYTISRMRDALDTIYNDDEVFTSNQRALIEKQTLCIGPRTQNSTDLSGAEECSKTLENENLGLLQVNEYLLPSIDNNCHAATDRSCLNYNYMTDIKYSFWTMTPSPENTYQNYRIANAIYIAKSSSNANILFTLHLSDKTQISGGSGTQEDPYIVNDYSTSNKNMAK